MENKLSILVVGSGGREFAICKKFKESSLVKEVYCAPGNSGMQTIGVKTVDIDEMDLERLLNFAQEKQISWTFVGPENVLCAGIVDKFQAAGQKVFGPNQRAAQLEGSKDYAVKFMDQYHVPTARHESFDDVHTCFKGLEGFSYPVVIKEDGLAGGKGVVIAPDEKTAQSTIQEMFNAGQKRVVLEECLVGPEYSIFLVVSENQYRILPMAQDHKRVGDGDQGADTGGMGSYCPLPQLSIQNRQKMIDEVVKPTMQGLIEGDYHYHGVLYIGLMMTKVGPKVIEYNVRLGDPETEVVLPKMQTDFAKLIDAAINETSMPEVIENNKSILGVVLCAEGYPKHLMQISLKKLLQNDQVYLDYANVFGDLNNLKNTGGRILMAISEESDLKTAQANVYDYLDRLDIPHTFYRHDIGNKAVR